jgi:hypothetical protein
MATFDEFLAALKHDVVAFAEAEGKEATNAALADGRAFVQSLEADLQRWTNELAAGQLSRNDLEFLVAGKRDLAELTALKAAGWAQARLDRFVNGLLSLVVSALVKTNA